uniref:Uncharacterized protein n=1 Tax=Knipowitschia caucasica TaxID=637954 RepID=A0AAV2J0I7_KNICA
MAYDRADLSVKRWCRNNVCTPPTQPAAVSSPAAEHRDRHEAERHRKPSGLTLWPPTAGAEAATRPASLRRATEASVATNTGEAYFEGGAVPSSPLRPGEPGGCGVSHSSALASCRCLTNLSVDRPGAECKSSPEERSEDADPAV